MREMCSACDRPARVCLCSVLPDRPLPTRTTIVVLQHPLEARHKLATVPLLARCLSNCLVFVGRKFRRGLCTLLDQCSDEAALSVDVDPLAGCRSCGKRAIVILLFPTPSAVDLKAWFQTLKLSRCQRGDSGAISVAEEVSECEDCEGERVVLLLVDGTWPHAKEMVQASMPFLENFVVQVSLPFDRCSEGWGMGEADSILRKEPFAGCVSTMEAAARALATLEIDGTYVESTLLCVLERMVRLQVSHFTPKRRQT